MSATRAINNELCVAEKNIKRTKKPNKESDLSLNESRISQKAGSDRFPALT